MTGRALQQVAAAIATWALLALASAAHAATYTQYLCQMPNGAPAPADGFLGYTAGTGASTADSCLAGGPLSASVPVSSQGTTYAGQTYHAPLDTTIAGVRVSRSTSGIAKPGNIKYAFVGTSDVCNADTTCPAGIAGGEYTADGPLTSADFQVYCPDNPGCQGTSGTASIRLHSLAITLDDATPPQLTSPPSGGLFSTGRTLSGQEPVGVSATDDGGGVFTAAVVVDGVERDRWVVDENGGACLQPFGKRVPCKLNVAASHPFDTTQLTNGAHAVSLVVYDATEVNNATFGPVDVVVDNTAPPPGGGGGGGSPPPTGAAGGPAAVESPAPAPQPGPQPAAPATPLGPSLVARIVPAANLGDGLISTRLGKPVRISGVLVDELRRPIPNARLAVFATPDEPGARPVLVGTATTTASGAFSYVADAGSSRTITVTYRPLGEGSQPAATLGAHVVVRAAVRLRASRARLRNGRTLTLTAHVLGHKRYRGRAKVAFQVLIGRTWRTFARAAADRHGVATATHRFRVTFTTVRYRFRALTLAARGFPYAAGRSGTVVVLVRP